MNKDLASIVGEVSFNYDDDDKEFGRGNRIVNITGQVDEEGTALLVLSFNLGRKDDDDVCLVFEAGEFMQKFLRALVYGENFSD